MAAARERARLHTELNSFVIANRGWPTGWPGADRFQFEAVDSSIADELREAGHKVSHIGTSERCTGFAGAQRDRSGIKHYAGIVRVEIFEVELPNHLPPEDNGPQHKPRGGPGLMRNCVICGKAFPGVANKKTCSLACSDENDREQKRRYDREQKRRKTA
jgi:hypothetical protein